MRGGGQRYSLCTVVDRTAHDTLDTCKTFASSDRDTERETNADKAESEMSPEPWSRDTRDTTLLCAVYTWFHRRRNSCDIEPRVGSSLGTSAYFFTLIFFLTINHDGGVIRNHWPVNVILNHGNVNI